MKARANQSSSNPLQSPSRIEQLDVIVTGDHRRNHENAPAPKSKPIISGNFRLELVDAKISSSLRLDSNISNNESQISTLVDQLRLIENNLHTLGQLLEQRQKFLIQNGLPASNDDLLLLYHQHKVRNISVAIFIKTRNIVLFSTEEETETIEDFFVLFSRFFSLPFD